MTRVALAALRRNKGTYAGTFLAALLAVALLAGGGLLLFSVLTAKPPADRFAAATAVVAGDREVAVETVTVTHKHKDGRDRTKVKRKVKTERLTGAGTLPPDLAGRIATVPAVARAVPDAAFPVQVATTGGRVVHAADRAPVVAHGWASAALTPYTLRRGAAPSSGEAVLDADLASRAGVTVGDPIVVTSKTGTRTLRVSGIAAPPGRAGLPAQGALFVPDGATGAISGLSGPTAIGVFAGPGVGAGALAAALGTAAGDARVLTGADKVRGDLPGALPDYIGPISIFGFLIGITGFAGMFVLTGTVALAVRQRLRELALLRAAGAAPGQLRTLLGLESVVLAAVAAVPGLPLGVLVAHLVAARFRTLGVVPQQFTVRVAGPVLLAAAFAGMMVAFLAARTAGRRAVRIAPTQALAETATEPAGGWRPRAVVAAAATAGAVALLVFVPLDGPLGMGMSFLSSALLLVAVGALGPPLVRLLTALLSRPAALGGVTGWLAGAMSRAGSGRVAGVAVPLVLMFTVNATMLSNSALLGRLAAAEQAARTAVATVQVTDPRGLPLDAARRLAALPGVTGAAATLPTRAVVAQGGKPEDHPTQGLLVTGTDPALDLGVSRGSIGAEGTLAASHHLVDVYGWRVGQRIPVWLADGYRVTLRLAAVYERSRGFGDLVLPARLVAEHDPRGLVSTVALRYKGNVAERIRADWPSLRVVPTVGAPPPPDAHYQRGAFELMMMISLGFTAIAVVDTFAIATVGRRREYADLRLAGATVGQIHALATAEAAITVAVGLLVGATVTAVVVGAFSVAQDGVFRLVVDPATYGGLFAGVAGLGLLAGTLPVRVLVRRRSVAAAPGER